MSLEKKFERFHVLPILGGLLLSGVVLWATWDLMVPHPHIRSSRSSLLSQLKQLSVGIAIYTADYDDRFPIAASWGDGVLPYIKNRSLFTLATMEERPMSDNVAFAGGLSRRQVAQIENPHRTVLLFESIYGVWNQSGGIERLAKPRQVGLVDRPGYFMGLADYTAKKFEPDKITSAPPEDLIWPARQASR